MRRIAATSLAPWAAALLLCLYWWMATSVSNDNCSTNDEIAHLTAGYTYWKAGDYRLQPENGNLPQRLAALPTVVKGTRFPTLDQAAWRISDEWELGFRWFYDSGNDVEAILRDGRRMIALLGVFAGCLVFYWGRRLFGDAGGVVATLLFTFSPSMLAHGALCTSDMAATLCFLLAVTAYWWVASRLSAVRLAGLGAATGLLCVSKFSAPLVLAMFALMAAVRVWDARDLPTGWPLRGPVVGRTRILLALMAATLAALLVAVLVIWASYGFRYAMFRNSDASRSRPIVGWETLETPGGLTIEGARFARAHRLLPEAYLYGFEHAYHFSRGREGFLNGDYGSDGSLGYFPYTVAVKTPLALFGLMSLAAIAVAGVLAKEERRRIALEATPLLALLVVYGGFALGSHLNIGHRHIIAVYPVFFAAAAGSVVWMRLRRVAGFLVACLLAWFACESLYIRPHYLEYFNELVGPADAWRHVVDASLDWGQDLPAVARFLRSQEASERVYLSYCGNADPAHYGIKATRFGDGAYDFRERRFPAQAGAGLWIISVGQFQQAYGPTRGPWTGLKEEHYRQLLKTVVGLAAANKPLGLEQASEFEAYQFARLCHVLRERKPDAEIAYTFLVFRLTDADVRRALYETLPGP